MRHFRSFLLLVVGSFLFLTAIQCTSPFAAIASAAPGIGNLYVLVVAPTKEEVAGSAIDISLDANRSWEVVQAECGPPPQPSWELHELKAEPPTNRRLLHRRILPSSPDDGL